MALPTLKSYCVEQGFTAVSPDVRENTNGYPFITLLKGKNAENIYFGIEASSEVVAGSPTKDIFAKLYVTTVENKDGEARVILTFKKGESKYLDISDL
jgi:ssDNA-specific exonuclease RecJ